MPSGILATPLHVLHPTGHVVFPEIQVFFPERGGRNSVTEKINQNEILFSSFRPEVQPKCGDLTWRADNQETSGNL